MEKDDWYFAPLAGGQEQGFSDNNIEDFLSGGLVNNWTREACQNSIDMVDDPNKPVKVVFEWRNLLKKDCEPVLKSFLEHVDRNKENWENDSDTKLKDFLRVVEMHRNDEIVPTVIVSDHNTKGAYRRKHAEEGYPKNTPWHKLTESNGRNCKLDETSGGLHGNGKNAAYPCTNFNMVFYNTLYKVDGKDESAFIGVTKTGSLLDKNGELTQGTGKFVHLEPCPHNKYYTIISQEHENAFRDMFKRQKGDYGLDVIHLSFNQEENWMETVKQAVLKNFFVAIYKKKLVVEIKKDKNTIVINDTTLDRQFAEYENDNDPDMKDAIQFYKTFTEPTCKETIILKRHKDSEDDSMDVYYRSDINFDNKVAHFRNNGMLIKVRQRGKGLYCYSAVAVVHGEAVCKSIRETEPLKHDDWNPKLIEKNPEKYVIACRYLKNIREKIAAFIKKQHVDITQDAVDAAGAAEILPAIDPNCDLMMPKLKNGKVLCKKNAVSPITNVKAPKPQKGNNNGGNGGTSEISASEFPLSRAFSTDPEKGECKVFLQPIQKQKNIVLSLFAMKEEGEPDDLNILSFKDSEGKKLEVSDGKVGPIDIPEDTLSVFTGIVDLKGSFKFGIGITKEGK